MTTLPKLDDKNANYVLEMAETVVEKTDNRRAGSSGEEQARHLFLNEIMKYCDEVSESNFITNPGAGTAMHKFMQYCEFKDAAVSISDEIKRLTYEGKLTVDEADSLKEENLK